MMELRINETTTIYWFAETETFMLSGVPYRGRTCAIPKR